LTSIHPQNISRISAWILAIRPRTLPAAVAPVVVGSALAFSHRSFAFLPAAAAMMVAFFLQIAVNLANDYFDFMKGIDTDDRLGPRRVTQSGLIPSEHVKIGIITTFVLAAVPGLYLLKAGGWPVLLIGLACGLAVLAYSGGPYPLASYGLGDLFVFIFFGLIAVGGTYYVQTLQMTLMSLLMGVIVGLMITAILVVNNLRDIQTDRRAGKHTLAVTIGERGTRIEYSLLHAGAYGLTIVIWQSELTNGFILLPLLSLPLAVALNRTIWIKSSGEILNQALARTVQLALVFSLLLSIGLFLS
jgi:1,4-dihydroxy-2-naphthoate octaprenyltransferase